MMESQKNRLLEALSPEVRRRVLLIARRVELPQHAVLFEPDERNEQAYFLLAGIASLTVNVPDGGSAEIGMLGNETLAGAVDVLGAQPPVARCTMQTAGAALRVSLPDLRRLFAESDELRGLLLQTVQYQHLLLSQIAACNRLHRASERLARWLLTASDYSGSNVMPLTQESLSQLLGTRRTTVALVAGTMEREGLIHCGRGSTRIVSRERLQAAACACYEINRRTLERLYQQQS